MKEAVMKWVFMAAAAVSILAVGLICIFLFANGVPAIGKIGVADFLLGKTWKPGNNIYGIFPMIVGKLIGGVTAIGVAMLLVPKDEDVPAEVETNPEAQS